MLTAEEIVAAITSCDDLHSLELKGNTLGVGAAKAIGIALERHSNFKVTATLTTMHCISNYFKMLFKLFDVCLYMLPSTLNAMAM